MGKTSKGASKNNSKRVKRSKTNTFENNNTYRKSDQQIKKTKTNGKSENKIGKLLDLDIDDKENDPPTQENESVQSGTIIAESHAYYPVKKRLQRM